MSNAEVVKKAIDELVSDFGCCDRSGCQCFEAQSWMKLIKEYAESRLCPACHDERDQLREENEKMKQKLERVVKVIKEVREELSAQGVPEVVRKF